MRYVLYLAKHVTPEPRRTTGDLQTLQNDALGSHHGITRERGACVNQRPCPLCQEIQQSSRGEVRAVDDAEAVKVGKHWKACLDRLASHVSQERIVEKRAPNDVKRESAPSAERQQQPFAFRNVHEGKEPRPDGDRTGCREVACSEAELFRGDAFEDVPQRVSSASPDLEQPYCGGKGDLVRQRRRGGRWELESIKDEGVESRDCSDDVEEDPNLVHVEPIDPIGQVRDAEELKLREYDVKVHVSVPLEEDKDTASIDTKVGETGRVG